MTANIIHHPIFGKPVRLLICAALACGITAVTTQVIISSAGQPEYGMDSTARPAGDSAPGVPWRIILARAA